MSEAEEETYWVVRAYHASRNRTLHTRPDCTRIKADSNVQETTREAHPDNDICSYCSGELEQHDGGSAGPHEILREIDASDVGGDALAQ